ncbi:conjugal transfer family protein (plasmid) [Burkholderia gladioli]|uniref:Conjugal transfer family protein n=1 Tax=Burkholderia gladioli TaxID=28095 RepID=A0AAW3FCU4_BURGA|nr:TrbG/VirB9 family P-type conjugative transfer protein [Burkholderia gladioli]AJW93654.1 conjugal transfer family protein [Burkholderia gladioli]KGC24007.1 conjugal transfer family protein [Burkholderia gladioli]
MVKDRPIMRAAVARGNFQRLAAVALVVIGMLTSSASAQAAVVPPPGQQDPRVQRVPYDPQQVYSVTGVYGYVSRIDFPRGEVVLKRVLGDTLGWQVRYFKNHVFAKPVLPNAKTNLMVTTTRGVYQFDLTSSTDPSRLTYALDVMSSDEDGDMNGDASGAMAGVGASTDAGDGFQQPRVVNQDYQAAGDERKFGLQRVFDDGQFTYFLFVGNYPKPEVYSVGPDGTELLLDTRREGPYLVATQLSDRFTVRDGSRTLCIARGSVLTSARQGTPGAL